MSECGASLAELRQADKQTDNIRYRGSLVTTRCDCKHNNGLDPICKCKPPAAPKVKVTRSATPVVAPPKPPRRIFTQTTPAPIPKFKSKGPSVGLNLNGDTIPIPARYKCRKFQVASDAKNQLHWMVRPETPPRPNNHPEFEEVPYHRRTHMMPSKAENVVQSNQMPAATQPPQQPTQVENANDFHEPEATTGNLQAESCIPPVNRPNEASNMYRYDYDHVSHNSCRREDTVQSAPPPQEPVQAPVPNSQPAQTPVPNSHSGQAPVPTFHPVQTPVPTSHPAQTSVPTYHPQPAQTSVPTYHPQRVQTSVPTYHPQSVQTSVPISHPEQASVTTSHPVEASAPTSHPVQAPIQTSHPVQEQIPTSHITRTSHPASETASSFQHPQEPIQPSPPKLAPTSYPVHETISSLVHPPEPLQTSPPKLAASTEDSVSASMGRPPTPMPPHNSFVQEHDTARMRENVTPLPRKAFSQPTGEMPEMVQAQMMSKKELPPCPFYPCSHC